ncbi:hypothetical protein ALC57_14628 [Trachymyrmex cornetzi]|uniref:Uncharacterized protein n=1 Tax=Trachymyrmex cornetzi TaxID=471704 RepID=A0A151IYC8_9HYME|nr:hypothetical protein ALC57_14628 [Trachymyrmex cornetzi]
MAKKRIVSPQSQQLEPVTWLEMARERLERLLLLPGSREEEILPSLSRRVRRRGQRSSQREYRRRREERHKELMQSREWRYAATPRGVSRIPTGSRDSSKGQQSQIPLASERRREARWQRAREVCQSCVLPQGGGHIYHVPGGHVRRDYKKNEGED